MKVHELKVRRLASLLLLLVAVTAAGCETVPEARYVEKSPNYGVIALPYYSAENRALADQLMQQHFPYGYQVDREFEHVTGSITEQQEHDHVGQHHSEIHHASGSDDHPAHSDEPFRHPTSAERRTVSTTRDTTEWRIFYSRAKE